MRRAVRPPGRPRRELRRMEEVLAPYGGVWTVIQAMEATGMVLREIREALAKRTGVSVTDRTLRRWIASFEGRG